MSDIVERLRDASYAQAPSRCMEAANEIERLRAVLAIAKAALEKIATGVSDASGIREGKS